MDKQHILDEIRKTAAASGGAPLGKSAFFRETGIKEGDWLGKHWARWGDALREAGLAPNQMQIAYSGDFVIERLIELIRELGRFPVHGELKLKRRSDPTFPSHNAVARLGLKRDLAVRVVEYCKARGEHSDVVALCAPIAAGPLSDSVTSASSADSKDAVKEGYLYMALLRLGRERRYKIGKAVLVERRTDEISIQLPEALELVHAIRTDDAYGIEDYWHRRFATKNTKGEWFALSRQDIDAFRRRKFM